MGNARNVGESMTTIDGILNGYLPFEGVAEILVRGGVVLEFHVVGEAKAAMDERADCYVNLIGKPVLVDVRRRKIVGLRAAP